MERFEAETEEMLGTPTDAPVQTAMGLRARARECMVKALSLIHI